MVECLIEILVEIYHGDHNFTPSESEEHKRMSRFQRWKWHGSSRIIDKVFVSVYAITDLDKLRDSRGGGGRAAMQVTRIEELLKICT